MACCGGYEVRDQLKRSSELSEPFGRFTEHLAANGINLARTPATFGLPLAFDGKTERFTGENADDANALLTREYRKPWVVPQLA